ncbi:hypothetical protein QFC22_006708 [Naganishia vaughanmartiniae]|uniref:Uncharacterized protein n=1 Tax=Naganishia vaughanmartiniae TaxID=1424756 RepID=A0ACC2WHI8_9TREE|nr:hypothetical protein QFC22_006708 [Naganishia vaughanmartiniae]
MSDPRRIDSPPPPRSIMLDNTLPTQGRDERLGGMAERGAELAAHGGGIGRSAMGGRAAPGLGERGLGPRRFDDHGDVPPVRRGLVAPGAGDRFEGGATPPDADDAIRGTDDDALTCRLSAIMQGYIPTPNPDNPSTESDKYTQLFTRTGRLPALSAVKRPPLINIGTHHRSWAVDTLVERFLESSWVGRENGDAGRDGDGETADTQVDKGISERQSRGRKQIVSLGAGSDSRFWRLMPSAFPECSAATRSVADEERSVDQAYKRGGGSYGAAGGRGVAPRDPVSRKERQLQTSRGANEVSKGEGRVRMSLASDAAARKDK